MFGLDGEIRVQIELWQPCRLLGRRLYCPPRDERRRRRSSPSQQQQQQCFVRHLRPPLAAYVGVCSVVLLSWLEARRPTRCPS